MLNILGDKSSGTCSLVSKLTVGKDPSDETASEVKGRFRFVISDAEDCEVWLGSEERPVFPGLKAKFNAVQSEEHPDKWPSEVWAPIGGKECKFALVPQRNTEQAGDGVRAAAVIVKAAAKVTHKATFVDVWLRFPGLNPDDVRGFMDLLRGALHTELNPDQGTLPFEKGEAA